MLTSILSAATIAISASAAGGGLQCKDLQKAYKADLMNVEDYTCATGDNPCAERQLAQLRQTVKLFTQDDPTGKSMAELKDEYDPIFNRTFVGGTAFETVNIDLGDNPFVAFYKSGTREYAEIRIDDGSTSVGADYCDVSFEPVIDKTRLENLCAQIVPIVSKEAPASTFTLERCVSKRKNKDTGNTSLDVYVDRFDRDTLELTAQRNLSDVGAWYVACKATMDRKTSDVTAVSCEVK